MFCISSSQAIFLPLFFSQNISCTSSVILTRTGLIPCILQGEKEERREGGRKLSSRAPQVVRQVILSLSTLFLTLLSPVACLGAGKECLSQLGLQKLRVEQRQLLRLHCVLSRAWSVPTSSLRSYSTSISNCTPSLSWCCPASNHTMAGSQIHPAVQKR